MVKTLLMMSESEIFTVVLGSLITGTTLALSVPN